MWKIISHMYVGNLALLLQDELEFLISKLPMLDISAVKKVLSISKPQDIGRSWNIRLKSKTNYTVCIIAPFSVDTSVKVFKTITLYILFLFLATSFSTIRKSI